MEKIKKLINELWDKPEPNKKAIENLSQIGYSRAGDLNQLLREKNKGFFLINFV